MKYEVIYTVSFVYYVQTKNINSKNTIGPTVNVVIIVEIRNNF